MKNYSIVLFLLSVIWISGCVSAQPQLVEFRPSTIDGFTEKLYESNLKRLGVVGNDSNSNFNYSTLLIYASFDRVTSINVTSDVSVDPSDPFEYYSLELVIWDFKKDLHEQYASYSKFTYIQDRYIAKITKAEIDKVFQSLSSRDFYAGPFEKSTERVCADGTIYYIELKVDDEHNLIARHSCDPGFVGDFQFSDALIDLAKEKFPVVADEISQSQQKILAP